MRAMIARACVWMGMAAGVLGVSAQVRGEGVLDLAKKPGERVWVSVREETPSEAVRGEPPMLARVHGVIGELSRGQVQELVGCVEPGAAMKEEPAGARRVCVVHMDGPAGKRSVELVQSGDGTYAAREMGGASSACWKLRGERVDRLLGAVGGYLGEFGDGKAEGAGEGGRVVEVERPYQVGVVTLDARTVAERIGASEYIRFDAPTRVLGKEQFRARAPVGYSARAPAGLVVWVDPGASGRPPGPLFKALDELGMVCIGAANSGNDRGVTDRLQLALDGVATARRRWNIDPARVYVVGVSGGGKMSSILAPCFADVFAGAVPIVGLSTFERMRMAEGKAWPAEYSRPRGKRWEEAKRVRMAAVTGSRDFNHEHVVSGVSALEKAGLRVRLVDVAGLGHEWPGEDEVLKQLSWVDEPGRTAAATREREAKEAMEKMGKDAGRGELLEVVRKWPWTRGAWEAVGRVEGK